MVAIETLHADVGKTILYSILVALPVGVVIWSPQRDADVMRAGVDQGPVTPKSRVSLIDYLVELIRRLL